MHSKPAVKEKRDPGGKSGSPDLPAADSVEGLNWAARDVLKIAGRSRREEDDLVAREIPLAVDIEGDELAVLLCSPLDLEDLVRGFLFTNGLIEGPADIGKIAVDRKTWTARVFPSPSSRIAGARFRRVHASGGEREALMQDLRAGGPPGKAASGFGAEETAIGRLMADFLGKCEGFRKTGGLHGAALAANDGITVFREDIGRHNAVDKAIGRAILEKTVLDDQLLLTTGRISSEIVHKARRAGIPIIVSKGAPTDRAAGLAADFRIALVGYARGDRMNVYSERERVR